MEAGPVSGAVVGRFAPSPSGRLHAVLDFRRAIDVPGYDRIPLAEETRFIATMNYGYAGTRELNEALTSRFAVVQMPTITPQDVMLHERFPRKRLRFRTLHVLA